MKLFDIEIEIKNKPELDHAFVPLHKFNKAFLATAGEPFSFALERNDKQISVRSTCVHGDKKNEEADKYYIERLIKNELWQKGGFRLYVRGHDYLCQMIKKAYSPGGIRFFDASFMAEIFQKEFEVIICDELPGPFEIEKAIGRNFDGCRIGFDAGGSDYKVSAVVDGTVVYSKETIWHPKQHSDPEYHYDSITSALRDAMDHLPRVDAIGISSAGIFADNRLLYAQLFQKVPKDQFDLKVRDIYFRAVREIGENIPFKVANDGDVTALAGSITMNRNNILGIAMGTSVAGGFVDKTGNIPSRMNEIAFMPVDASPMAAQDDWSGDIGLAVKYFSQEAVIKLSKTAGISLSDSSTPAEKLEAVQKMLEDGNDKAASIFRTIGCYLGHTAPLYYDIYEADAILLLGRVMSGEGGNIIEKTAKTVLLDEYPEVSIDLLLPDEKTRRVGQSVIAASLPEVK